MKNEMRHWSAIRILCGCLVCLLLLGVCAATRAAAAEDTPALQTVQVGIPVEEHPELFLTRSMPTQGEARLAVFLIDFPDYPNDNPVATQEYYEKIYFRGFNGPSLAGYESVADFYAKQSYDKLHLSGQVFDWYTAQHERSYYDNRKAELVMEAAEYYRSQGVDFSQFDGDEDGIIDSIIYHFAGDSSSDDQNDPWYQGVRYGISGEIGNVVFTTVIQVFENADENMLTPMRVIWHELMHNLGMPDLYSKTRLNLVPTNDLMGDNQYVINPYFKMMLGWVDSVRVITGDVVNVRLNLFENSGEFAIVTNEFNGFFDEFYLVAYRDDFTYSNAVIWHIDARLNENGTSFAYQNLLYDPQPDKTSHSSVSNQSPYPFIEEISADPDFDYIINRPFSPQNTAFGKDSVLGPDNMPCSDTHDGDYTGIQIHNFKEYNEEYMTFDVSFVDDYSSPFIVTEANDLEFNQTVKITFNEHVYAGENWQDVQALNMEDQSLPVSIQLSHYPRNEMEITFETDDYKDGYRLVFPEGAVRDSSGNDLAAVTLTASKERYLSPICCEQLPGTGEFIRNNGEAYFFPQEDSLVVITALWENHVLGAKVEFMRLDYDGNVLNQTIVDNPFADSEILYVTETGDSCYIFVCCQNSRWSYYELLFCIDREGQLKWSNDAYLNTGVRFFGRQGYQSIKREDGVVIVELTNRKIVYISSETGQVQEISIAPYPSEQLVWSPFFDLSEGKLLYTQSASVNGKHCTRLEIIDSNTLEVIARGILEGTAEEGYSVEHISSNSDGTILLYCTLDLEAHVFLLDAELNVTKSIQLRKLSNNGNFLKWLENDGFYEIYRTEKGDHSNNEYNVRRFDRYLNVIWETDVVSEFVYFFKNSSEEIMAYKSMFLPERECYIEYYGSEDAFRTEHIHSLVYAEAVSATCLSEGMAKYWYCTDCGCYFSDEGQTVITDMKVLALPKGDHTEVVDKAVAATCTTTGLTEGRHCSVCNKVLTAQEKVAVLPHTEVIDTGVVPACTVTGLTEGKHCDICGAVLIAQEEVAATGHRFGEWIVTKEATRKEVGEETRVCSVCSAVEIREIPAVEGVNPIVIAVTAVAAIVVIVVVILAKKKKK